MGLSPPNQPLPARIPKLNQGTTQIISKAANLIHTGLFHSELKNLAGGEMGRWRDGAMRDGN